MQPGGSEFRVARSLKFRAVEFEEGLGDRVKTESVAVRDDDADRLAPNLDDEWRRHDRSNCPGDRCTVHSP